MFKITIEGPDLEQPVVFEYEYVTVAAERGVERVYTPGPEGFCDPYDLVSNGRRRLLGLTGHVCNSWVASTSGAWLCPVCGRPATEISWVVQEVIDEPR